MFKLVALLFAITNGVPSDKLIDEVAYPGGSFASKEACISFLNSEEGKAETGAVEAVANQHGASVRFVCQESKATD